MKALCQLLPSTIPVGAMVSTASSGGMKNDVYYEGDAPKIFQKPVKVASTSLADLGRPEIEINYSQALFLWGGRNSIIKLLQEASALNIKCPDHLWVGVYRKIQRFKKDETAVKVTNRDSWFPSVTSKDITEYANRSNGFFCISATDLATQLQVIFDSMPE